MTTKEEIKECEKCLNKCECHKYDHMAKFFKNNQRPVVCLFCDMNISPQKYSELYNEFVYPIS